MEANAAEEPVPMEMLTALQGSVSNPVRLEVLGTLFTKAKDLASYHQPHLFHVDPYMCSSQTTRDMGFECSNTTFLKLGTSVGIECHCFVGTLE